MLSYPEAVLKGEEADVLRTILDATKEIAGFLRCAPVFSLLTQNKFGDTQLHQDIKTDEIVQKHLRNNPRVKGFASQERPELHLISEGSGFIVTYDPLDGSSVIDSNFSIGSIFSIWKTQGDKILGQTLRSQANAVLAIYGSRTTVIIYNQGQNKVQQLTLIDETWVVSHNDLRINSKSKIFSPGNLRAASEVPEYQTAITNWIAQGYTLRYTGGLVPDVNQIFIKAQGILINLGSKSHKCKIRALYEAAAVGFLIERAGGNSVTTGRISLLDYKFTSYDDRLSFAVGSAEQIDRIAHLF